VIAAAVPLKGSEFRYERTVSAAAAGPLRVVADGPLFAHAQPGLGDVRFVDANGAQVPWRRYPEPAATPLQSIRVLDSGRRGNETVALLDLGPARRVVDHVDLRLPARRFLGRVTVYGSDDRRTFTRLGTTTVYDVAGARAARSTEVVFPPSDLRYLSLRGRGIPPILGATIAGTPRASLRRIPAHVRLANGEFTTIEVDLGYAKVPVDELRIPAAPPRYRRELEVMHGDADLPVTSVEISRFPGSAGSRVPVATTGRFLHLTIRNGDDPPLRGIRVAAYAGPRALLVEGGRPLPLKLLYGATTRAPSYDYEAMPRSALDLGRVSPARLGPEHGNPTFAFVDTRSFAKRHPIVIQAALALAAVALAVGGVLALRRRA